MTKPLRDAVLVLSLAMSACGREVACRRQCDALNEAYIDHGFDWCTCANEVREAAMRWCTRCEKMCAPRRIQRCVDSGMVGDDVCECEVAR